MTESEARPREGEDRDRQVRAIFSSIAGRYDLLNHVLSLNVDKRWRRKAVDRLVLGGTPTRARVLDACAGTLDLSLELAGRGGFQGTVIASDFAHPMLKVGVDKLNNSRVLPVCSDTLGLPFPDGTFDGAMVAFGVRNLSDVDAGFRELGRVLRQDARLVVLEFTTPPNPLLRPLYLLYFRRILPFLGKLVSGHPWAYEYLPESVREFPGPEALARKLAAAGFETPEWEYLTGGIAAIHVARRRG
ncbi:MAG: ubiquinone/menaquinone biosynthesis methyltransferase [Gemmatimonadota bacterium]